MPSILTDERVPEGVDPILAEYLNRMFRDARLSDIMFPEEPREIGDTGQPAFGLNWGNVGAPFQVASFYKDKERVHITGVVSNASGGSGTIVFTLPDGYRPFATELYEAVASGDGHGEILISANGNVILTGSGSASTQLSLSGLSFRISKYE